MPMLSRRGLITGLAALVAAPAIVRFDSIMPVRNVGLRGAVVADLLDMNGNIIKKFVSDKSGKILFSHIGGHDLRIRFLQDGGVFEFVGENKITGCLDIRPVHPDTKGTVSFAKSAEITISPPIFIN